VGETNESEVRHMGIGWTSMDTDRLTVEVVDPED
jgi:hypothetical protein